MIFSNISIFDFCSNNIKFNIFELLELGDKLKLANTNKTFFNLFMKLKIDKEVVIEFDEHKAIETYPNIKFICDIDENKNLIYDELKKIRNAYSISISKNSNLNHINCLENVIHLDLFRCDITDISGLKYIKRLTITGCENIKDLPSLQHLKYLDASNCGLKTISELPNIEDFLACCSDITNITPLYKSTKLKNIDVYACDIPLSQVKTLCKINTKNNRKINIINRPFIFR